MAVFAALVVGTVMGGIAVLGVLCLLPQPRTVDSRREGE